MAALPLSQMSSSATDLKTKHLWAALELLRRTHEPIRQPAGAVKAMFSVLLSRASPLT